MTRDGRRPGGHRGGVRQRCEVAPPRTRAFKSEGIPDRSARRLTAPAAHPTCPNKIEFSFLNDILMVTAGYLPILNCADDSGGSGQCRMGKELVIFSLLFIVLLLAAPSA
jgi:hypothetical protein